MADSLPKCQFSELSKEIRYPEIRHISRPSPAQVGANSKPAGNMRPGTLSDAVFRDSDRAVNCRDLPLPAPSWRLIFAASRVFTLRRHRLNKSWR